MREHSTRLWRLLAVILALTLVAAACGDDSEDAGDDPVTTDPGGDDPAPDDTDELIPVSLQLQWVPQSQFAGYFAARALNFYEDLGLDVTIVDGGGDIVPVTVLDSGGADFAISWVPRALASREQGLGITNIAQVFQRSGTLQVSFADSGINSVEDLAGKNVGNWGFGNEFELFAGLASVGLDLQEDVTIVTQDFNMTALINGDIDAAQAMTYNEYAQVLETINPETGELFQPEDLSVINWNDVGVAMLQDAIWADADRLESDPEYRDIAVRFVEGSLRGWAHCRDNFQLCVDIVVGESPPFGGPGHQAWMMNEINDLIWPSPLGVGVMDPALWDQTVEIATSQGVLEAAPTDGAFRTDIVEEAIANIEGDIDVFGNDYEKLDVQVTEGGE